MQLLKITLFGLMLFAFLSPPIMILAQQNDTPIAVLNERQQVPAGAISKGHIKIGYQAFKIRCDYETIISQAKEKAREMGGNLVKITKSADPDAWNSCYRIKADIFLYDNVDRLIKQETSKIDSISSSLIPDTAHYALLYIYRPKLFQGAIIGYNIHLGKDSIICRSQNGSKYIVKVFQEGPTEIWGATESRSTVKPDIKFGKAYFIRCTIKMGLMVGEPNLRIIDRKKGLTEFEDIDFDAPKEAKDGVY